MTVLVHFLFISYFLAFFSFNVFVKCKWVYRASGELSDDGPFVRLPAGETINYTLPVRSNTITFTMGLFGVSPSVAVRLEDDTNTLRFTLDW